MRERETVKQDWLTVEVCHGCVMGVSGGSHCRCANLISSCKSPTRRNYGLWFGVGSKGYNESKDRKKDILLFVL